MSLILHLSQSVYPAIGFKNLISAALIFLLSDRFRDQFSLPYSDMACWTLIITSRNILYKHRNWLAPCFSLTAETDSYWL